MKLLVEVSLLILALFNAQWFVLCPVRWVRFVCVVCSHVDAFMKKQCISNLCDQVLCCFFLQWVSKVGKEGF